MNNTEPLDEAHGQVDARARVVRRESAHEGIELGRCRADAKEERDFDEDNEERARTAES